MNKIIISVLISILLLSLTSSVSFSNSKSCEFFGEDDGVSLQVEIRRTRILLQIENIADTAFTINSFFDSFYAKSWSGKTYRLRVVFPEYYSCVLTPGDKWLIILQKPKKLKNEEIQSIFLYLGSQKRQIWLMRVI